MQAQELKDPDNPSDCIYAALLMQMGVLKPLLIARLYRLPQLKEIGQYLIHINGQHASQLLLKNDYQLQLVDSFAHHHDLLRTNARRLSSMEKSSNAS